MTDAALIIFLGRFRLQSFRDFVTHRAGKLALQADIRTAHVSRVEVAVTGAAELIDAFELACSLGPIDCLVFDHYRVASGGVGTAATRRHGTGEIWAIA